MSQTLVASASQEDPTIALSSMEGKRVIKLLLCEIESSSGESVRLCPKKLKASVACVGRMLEKDGVPSSVITTTSALVDEVLDEAKQRKLITNGGNRDFYCLYYGFQRWRHQENLSRSSQDMSEREKLIHKAVCCGRTEFAKPPKTIRLIAGTN